MNKGRERHDVARPSADCQVWNGGGYRDPEGVGKLLKTTEFIREEPNKRIRILSTENNMIRFVFSKRSLW